MSPKCVWLSKYTVVSCSRQIGAADEPKKATLRPRLGTHSEAVRAFLDKFDWEVDLEGELSIRQHQADHDRRNQVHGSSHCGFDEPRGAKTVRYDSFVRAMTT